MHHRTIITTATALVALALGATACDDQTVTTTPDKTASAKSSSHSASAKASPSPKLVAAVGDALTLKGQESGEKLAVTVKKWLDPAKGADEFNTPQSGKRWVAAQFELRNTGTTVYADSPANGVQVADAEGQRFDSWFGEIAAGPQMTSDLKLPAGEKALGWIVFEVPKASKIKSVQFTLNSGFAEQTGQWAVR